MALQLALSAVGLAKSQVVLQNATTPIASYFQARERAGAAADRLGRVCASRGTSPAGSMRAREPYLNGACSDAKQSRNALVAVVDDDQTVRDGLDMLVASLGYSGAMFASAEDYLVSDVKQRARCLILDVHLGGMSGPDLQSRLLADGYCTPVIFLTARFEEHVRDRVMEAGAFGYLIKPCDETILSNFLEQTAR